MTGKCRVSWLDARDIGAAAARLVLASPAERAPFVSASFELSGPYAHTAGEMAEILGLVAGRPIAHVDGVEAFVARCKELGVPDTAKHFYGEAAGGWFAAIHDDEHVKLLGRRAKSFAKFAMDHAAFFGTGRGD